MTEPPLEITAATGVVTSTELPLTVNLYLLPYEAPLIHTKASCAEGLAVAGAVAAFIAGTFFVLVMKVKSAIVTALMCCLASVTVDK